MKNLSLLGEQRNQLHFRALQPEVLISLWQIVMWKMTILSNLTALNLPHFAQLPLSQTLRPLYFYIPDKSSVSRSKSSSSTLFSYRNHGDFHSSMSTPSEDLVNLLNPRYLEFGENFTPRSGISIDPYYNYGKPGTKYGNSEVASLPARPLSRENWQPLNSLKSVNHVNVALPVDIGNWLRQSYPQPQNNVFEQPVASFLVCSFDFH